MISLIREKVLQYGWLSESDFLNFIAVSESTPGPLAVNMATFIGSSQAGLAGAIAATFGVVLPSFVIILMIAALIRSFLKYSGVQAFLIGRSSLRRSDDSCYCTDNGCSTLARFFFSF